MSKEGEMGGKRTNPNSSVRLEPDLLQWLKERANAGDRSLNAEINRVLRMVMVADAQDKLNLPHSDAVDTVLECGISELKSSTEKTGEVFSGKLYTLVEVYQQAVALTQIDGCGVHVELTLGQPDPFNSDVFPCCSGCIHFTEHDFMNDGTPDEDDADYGTCMRYPQKVRVEWAGRCGEYLGGAIFADRKLEKIGK